MPDFLFHGNNNFYSISHCLRDICKSDKISKFEFENEGHGQKEQKLDWCRSTGNVRLHVDGFAEFYLSGNIRLRKSNKHTQTQMITIGKSAKHIFIKIRPSLSHNQLCSLSLQYFNDHAENINCPHF